MLDTVPVKPEPRALRFWRAVRQPAAQEKIFCFLMVLLGCCFAISLRTYVMLRVAGWFVLLAGLARASKLHPRDCPAGLIAAALFCLYVIVTPGDWLADYKLGWRMALPLCLGAAAPLFSRRALPLLIWSTSLTLCALFICSAGTGFIWGFTPDARLVLRFAHPNTLAPVLSWCLLFQLDSWNGLDTRGKRYAAPLMGLCLIMLILTGSRTSLLAFGVAALMLLCVRFSWKTGAAVLLIGTLCAGIAYTQLPASQQTRLTSAILQPYNDPTFQSRRPIWEAAARGFASHPVLGTSFQGFTPFHAAYVRDNWKSLNQRFTWVEKDAFSPHSLYLFLLFAYGLTGTILFAAALAQGGFLAWRQRDMFFGTVLLSSAVQGVFEAVLPSTQGGLMLFFPLGLVYGRELAAKLFPSPADHAVPSAV